MTLAALATSAPRKRGPNTPEGKARSRMNALKHGLRARAFGILPDEDPAEWAEHVHDLRAGYGPVDATEEKLVTAIAVAMWQEIRADRVEADVMAETPPCRPGRSHGTDMQEPAHRLSLGTALRYASAAGMATQRAQRAFLAHRKAKRAGLLLPPTENEPCADHLAPAPSPKPAAAPEEARCTNGLAACPSPLALPPPASDAIPTQQKFTNDFPPGGPLTAPHGRIGGIPCGPGWRLPCESGLAVVPHALREHRAAATRWSTATI